jgi:hypothetical protein
MVGRAGLDLTAAAGNGENVRFRAHGGRDERPCRAATSEPHRAASVAEPELAHPVATWRRLIRGDVPRVPDRSADTRRHRSEVTPRFRDTRVAGAASQHARLVGAQGGRAAEPVRLDRRLPFVPRTPSERPAERGSSETRSSRERSEAKATSAPTVETTWPAAAPTTMHCISLLTCRSILNHRSRQRLRHAHARVAAAGRETHDIPQLPKARNLSCHRPGNNNVRRAFDESSKSVAAQQDRAKLDGSARHR